MAGKRIVDLAALLNASRSVAQKHVALRSRQLDVYTKTSTLAKAVISQTERVTETAKAAAFLASRLNESGPTWASNTASAKSDDATIPSKRSTEVDSAPSQDDAKKLLDEDVFHDKSQSHGSRDPVPTSDLDIRQENASRRPLPDGTIPPSGSTINVQEMDQDSISIRSAEPVIEFLSAEGGVTGLQPSASSESSIPVPDQERRDLSPDEAKLLQRQCEEQIPSRSADAQDEQVADKLAIGHDMDTFNTPSTHTSSVLSSLPRVKIPKWSGNTQASDEHLQSVGINSDTFSSPMSGVSSEIIPHSQSIPEQDEIPEGINADVFHSPRVAKLLGGKQYNSRDKELKLKAAESTPVDTTPLAQGRDQETFNVRDSSQDVSDIDESNAVNSRASTDISSNDISNLAKDIADETVTGGDKASIVEPVMTRPVSPYEMRESKVPSSRLARIWNFGGLAAGMFGGAITESIRRATGSGSEGSYMLSAGNMDRLVAALSRMRGAALKLGQMMSFQDSKMLPPAIHQVLLRVQDNADYMPPSQRNKVLSSNLGPDWRDLFDEFEEKPIAAASIGQVHAATLKSTGERVAVKVQYPGVATSIDSDLNNLSILLTASRLLPKGLFLEKTIANARTELAWECDYNREAECGRKFLEFLSDEKDVFVVPKVVLEASGEQVLTMQYMDGIGVTKVQNFTQEQRDWIGTQILRLCLREITEFKFMQTDPNWTNFLYNTKTHKLELLDFGASREYPDEFIDLYMRLLLAASRSDKDAVRALSIKLGYLTGEESKSMVNAHVSSVLTLAEPFSESSPEVYDFKDQTITDRVRALIPVMIQQRLSPPPEETYSLHRKLSGAFLLCARLGSRIGCRELFQNAVTKAGLA